MSTSSEEIRVGVDVGGTNTDAVLMRGRSVVASAKTPTTESVQDGIINALSDVVRRSGIDVGSVGLVCIGTTHFTNALVQRRDLDAVGVIRIALPAAAALPPFVDWPVDLATVVSGAQVMVGGGHQYDGRINAELDERAVAEAARQFRAQGIDAVAVSAVFGPVNETMESRVGEILAAEHPDCRVTLSSKIGRIGLLERENAGIMNASLATLAQRTIRGFEHALQTMGISAPLFVAQNDGTLMSTRFVEAYPVLTFASGPTNSMRGAAFLSGLKDALVADIGGTTTDVGVLGQGFPRESSIAVDIGGVRTNFRMPDILAIGLGGGSIVELEAGDVRIGPKSVGFEITQQALVFGGSTLTATDIAVAAGYANIGDKSLVSHLPANVVEAAVAEIHRMVEDALDRMKVSQEEMPLVLVGGGSILLNRELRGVSQVITAEEAGVANAIGASIAQVGGEIDKVFSYADLGRDGAIAQAVDEARLRAVAAGAAADTLEVMEIEELPLSYMPGGAVRLRVKVAGALATATQAQKR